MNGLVMVEQFGHRRTVMGLRLWSYVKDLVMSEQFGHE